MWVARPEVINQPSLAHSTLFMILVKKMISTRLFSIFTFTNQSLPMPFKGDAQETPHHLNLCFCRNSVR
jgi:hypothetical protein